MPELLLLIGLPGSGKSTLAQRLAANTPGWRVISTDEIRDRLFGDAAIQGPWPQIWDDVQRQFAMTVQLAQTQPLRGGIYDATNAVRRHRQAAIALARSVGFTRVTGLWLDVPLAVCLEHNHQRDHQVPPEVIAQMAHHLHRAPPRLHDGFDHLVHMVNFVGGSAQISRARSGAP